MGTIASALGTTSSYIYENCGDLTEIIPTSGQNKEYILKTTHKFTYVKEGRYYKLSTTENCYDKLIGPISTLKIFKVFRHGDGHIQIFSSFDGESGIYDVSDLFYSVYPLQAKDIHLYDLRKELLNTLKPLSVYECNTLCGLPLKISHTIGGETYSKSV